MTDNRPEGLHVVRQEGAPPRIVMVHGAMDRSVSFGRTVRRLADREVVRYDRRGYARSRHLPAGTLDDHVADLIGVASDGPTVLVGHSVGGVVALAAASLAPGLPELAAVLAYEAPSPWASWWPKKAEVRAGDAGATAEDEAEAFMRRMVGDRTWSRLGARTRADRRSEGDALRADLAMVERTERPYDPAAITVPVLSVAGSETTWWHRRAAEELADAVPLGRFALVRGASHGAHLTHPEALADLVRSLLPQGT